MKLDLFTQICSGLHVFWLLRVSTSCYLRIWLLLWGCFMRLLFIAPSFCSPVETPERHLYPVLNETFTQRRSRFLVLFTIKKSRPTQNGRLSRKRFGLFYLCHSISMIMTDNRSGLAKRANYLFTMYHDYPLPNAFHLLSKTFLSDTLCKSPPLQVNNTQLKWSIYFCISLDKVFLFCEHSLSSTTAASTRRLSLLPLKASSTSQTVAQCQTFLQTGACSKSWSLNTGSCT
jgi:hypothetical protein